MHSPPSIVYDRLVSQEQITADPAQQQAIEYLDALFYQLQQKHPTKKWYRHFLKSPQTIIKGCYLWGGVGTGKTMLMDIFSQCLDTQSVKRIHFHHFIREIHLQSKQIKNQQNPLEIIAKNFAQQTKVLCLDEFSVTDITDAMILSGLLKAFFEQQVVLVTTSNTTINNLYQDGIQRARFLPAIDLLNTHLTTINVDNNQDYRASYLQKSRLFFTPIKTDTNIQMQAIFKQLSSQNWHKTNIYINDRPIQVIANTTKEVWFDFFAICNTDRARDDFVEIAKHYAIVMISNITQMNDETKDIARRFIELIDALYDRNVSLIASANNSPKDLYTGSLLQQPFERTTSRLTEMFSNEYLTKAHRN